MGVFIPGIPAQSNEFIHTWNTCIEWCVYLSLQSLYRAVSLFTPVIPIYSDVAMGVFIPAIPAPSPFSPSPSTLLTVFFYPSVSFLLSLICIQISVCPFGFMFLFAYKAENAWMKENV